MSRKIFIEGFLWVLRARFSKQYARHLTTTPQHNVISPASRLETQEEQLPSAAKK